MESAKVGRPPKGTEPEHGRLGIRLSEDLLWEVREAAARAHLGLGDYVKAALQEKMKHDAEEKGS
jgi:hypothetical protein